MFFPPRSHAAFGIPYSGRLSQFRRWRERPAAYDSLAALVIDLSGDICDILAKGVFNKARTHLLCRWRNRFTGHYLVSNVFMVLRLIRDLMNALKRFITVMHVITPL